MKVGYIGLGNVGASLAGNILRNGFELIVRDLDSSVTEQFRLMGASVADSPRKVAEFADVIVTCLPNPEASASVMEGEDGALGGLREGHIWIEMSTTDKREIRRLAELVEAAGGSAADCPVSGGCHRAATGNIAIFAGCNRKVFDEIFPLLSVVGGEILHTGELGSASVLKVITNFLATANLVALCEALATTQASGVDLGLAYEAIRISSGNSFVHETESQVILNGSRDINFTMDLVLKDIYLFHEIADQLNLVLEVSPLLIDNFQDAQKRYGPKEWSPNVIRRLEDRTSLDITFRGFPAQIFDNEPSSLDKEVTVSRK